MPYRDAEDVRERMKQQVFSPVRWVDTINHMTANGITSIIECGPGKVLAGLIKRIDRDIAASCIDSSDMLKNSLDGANS
jgi:[acyl-carrier-protein] S-malonyltransferase